MQAPPTHPNAHAEDDESQSPVLYAHPMDQGGPCMTMWLPPNELLQGERKRKIWINYGALGQGPPEDATTEEIEAEEDEYDREYWREMAVKDIFPNAPEDTIFLSASIDVDGVIAYSATARQMYWRGGYDCDPTVIHQTPYRHAPMFRAWPSTKYSFDPVLDPYKGLGVFSCGWVAWLPEVTLYRKCACSGHPVTLEINSEDAEDAESDEEVGEVTYALYAYEECTRRSCYESIDEVLNQHFGHPADIQARVEEFELGDLVHFAETEAEALGWQASVRERLGLQPSMLRGRG